MTNDRLIYFVAVSLVLAVASAYGAILGWMSGDGALLGALVGTCGAIITVVAIRANADAMERERN